MTFIGIDLGTSAVKAILMDASGKLLQSVSRAYPLDFPRPGWSEQRPEDWEEAVLACLRELAQDAPSPVAGIGVGGQMHGLVALDDCDRVLRPAILWNDGRSAKQTEYLNREVGRDKLSQWTGNIAFAGFTAPKILWMRENEPELFARIHKIMLPKDYIVYKLTGAYSTDMSDASGFLLLDVKNRRYSRDMLGICGIEEAQLPKLYESYEVVGCVKKEIASALGLPENVRVVAGAGDNAAAAVGTGTVGNGRCNISLGTSGTVFIASDSFRVDENNALHAFAHADGAYHLMGCMLSAASCNKWWVEEILGSKDFAAEQAGIDAKSLGTNHVYFLPYLMGERSPHNDPDARGAFIGMRMDTSRRDMSLAILEGVAFALRDSVEIAKSLGIGLHASRLCGGGAQSPLWRQIMADCLHMDIEIVAAEEGPGLGAAMLAAVGCGVFANVEDAAAKLVRVAQTVTPNPEAAARYEQRYAQFKALYPALRACFKGQAEA